MRSVAAGDLDNDGNLDAITSTWSGLADPGVSDDGHNLLVVALGDGAGGFSLPIVTTDVGPYPSDENYIYSTGPFSPVITFRTQ